MTGYQKACIDYLRSFSWDLYAHLTFPESVTERYADVCIRKLIHQLNRWNYGSRYYKKKRDPSNQSKTEATTNPSNRIAYAIATEEQERGAIHYHVLIRRLRKPTETIAIKTTNAWRKLSKGNEHSAVVLAYNPALNGIEYMCKNIDPDHPLDVGGSMPGTQL